MNSAASSWPQTHMQVALHTPTAIVMQGLASKLTAEAMDGYFCLLPRHADFLAALVPGILILDIWPADLDAARRSAARHYFAVNDGILAKTGNSVTITTFSAVESQDLASLAATVERVFLSEAEQARFARRELARLEAGTLRRFMALETVASQRAF